MSSLKGPPTGTRLRGNLRWKEATSCDVNGIALKEEQTYQLSEIGISLNHLVKPDERTTEIFSRKFLRKFTKDKFATV